MSQLDPSSSTPSSTLPVGDTPLPPTASPSPAESLPAVAPPAPAPTARSRSNLKWFVVIGSVFLLLCAGACVFLAIFQLRSFNPSQLTMSLGMDNSVNNTIDQFMKLMVAKKGDEGYSLFSSRAKRQFPRSDIDKMINETNYVLFEGYERIEPTTWRVGSQFNANPNLPQGNVATIQGVVYYKDGYKGSFNAILEQENGAWRLDGINVTVSPEKMSEYYKRSE